MERAVHFAEFDPVAFVEEVEVTFDVAPSQLSPVMAAFTRPKLTLPLSTTNLNLTSSREAAALHVFLQAEEEDWCERLVFKLGEEGIAAEYAPKRWAGPPSQRTKLELRHPEQMDLEEAARFISENGQPAIAALFKKKRTLKYRGPFKLKARLDQVVALDPGSLAVRGSPFWNLELECDATQRGLAEAQHSFFSTNHLAPLPVTTSRKVDRVRLCAPAMLPSVPGPLHEFLLAVFTHAEAG